MSIQDIQNQPVMLYTEMNSKAETEVFFLFPSVQREDTAQLDGQQQYLSGSPEALELGASLPSDKLHQVFTCITY